MENYDGCLYGRGHDKAGVGGQPGLAGAAGVELPPTRLSDDRPPLSLALHCGELIIFHGSEHKVRAVQLAGQQLSWLVWPAAASQQCTLNSG